MNKKYLILGQLYQAVSITVTCLIRPEGCPTEGRVRRTSNGYSVFFQFP